MIKKLKETKFKQKQRLNDLMRNTNRNRITQQKINNKLFKNDGVIQKKHIPELI
jgi:hypothetical protein